MRYLEKKYKGINIESVSDDDPYCILESRVHGLFASFYCILYGLYVCEIEGIIPTIRLGNNHLYFDKTKGENIFEYFFENKHDVPLDKTPSRITIIDPYEYLRWCRISISERHISNMLISEYFIMKSYISMIIDKFVEDHFSNEVVAGVHYRGTDKVSETRILPFNIYEQQIDYLLANGICSKVLFVTDELHFKQYLKNRYGPKIILYSLEGQYTHKVQAGVGLHFSNSSPYLSAKDALIECHLLSKCKILVSSSRSSMSLFATFINPSILHVVLEP